ncbi:MAG: DUF1415 domain-containing protein [Gammaproteobacteria bacterium]|nr:DUF1415 domain-containing protein [Gammaproteobacteria bacterium]
MSSADIAIERTRHWLERLVIGENLCPFAAAPYRAGRVLFRVCEAQALDGVYVDFLQLLQELVDDAAGSWETGILILTDALSVFDDYLDGLEVMERAVSEAGLEGEFQVASFHPQYCFDGVAADDPSNYSNRSPLPLFHLIRERELAAVLAGVDHPERIPQRNIAHLRRLGIDGIRRLLADPDRVP